MFEFYLFRHIFNKLLVFSSSSCSNSSCQRFANNNIHAASQGKYTNRISMQANRSPTVSNPPSLPPSLHLYRLIKQHTLMDFITGVVFTHRVLKKLRCLEALVTGYFRVLRSFIEGKRGSLTRPLHHIHHPIGCSETSTLLTAFPICGRCLHLISTQNAPFSTISSPSPSEGGSDRSRSSRSMALIRITPESCNA